MPKMQYRNTDVARKISHVTFGVESAESLQQNAYLQVLSKDLYNNADSERAPSAYGVLDRRLGTSQKDGVCATCNKGIKECIGHFGYIDLELPVFHVGYFGCILNILQTICKKCSRVLLDEELKYKYRLRVNALGGHYVLKKFLRKKILLKAKKTSVCPECHELNGTVRKVTASMKIGGTGFLKILHEKFKSKKEKDNVIQRQQTDFYNATEMNPELKKCITTGLVHILTPIEVLNLFELIPEEDVPLLLMDTTRAHPKDLILTRMPVPPVCIRPSVTSTFKSGTNEDDLSAKQAEIIKANDSIRACRTSNVSKYQEMWDVLQNCSAQYINSELSIPQTTMSNVPSKPGRGLVQRLKGKQGRFRGNLSGKRVDFSARTVISPDPNLEIDQVGIPMLVAKILTFPERVTRANLQLMKQLIINGPNLWPGANYLYRKTPPYKEFYLRYGNRQQLANDLRLGDVVERHLKDGDVVLFNRQPSLHKLSIMAHHVKVHQHRTFRFNESVCNPYNADFDGDEMNVHLPQTEEAKAEALILMANKSNLVTARNGELLIAPTQDFLTGSYLLTKKDTFLDHRHACQLASTLLAGEDINMAIDLPPPAIWKPRRLWTGKQIFSLIFRPNKHCPVKANLSAKGKAYTSKKEMCWKDSYVIIRNSELLAGTVDKSHLGSGGKANNIFYVILRDFGQEYAIKSMWRCGRLASNYLMNTGFSIGIIDVTPGAELVRAKKNLLKQGYKKCDELIMDLKNNRLTPQPGCTPEQTLENKVLSELSVIRDRAGEACIEQLDPTNSPLIMALSGSKGSIINISQMIACVGQQALNGKRVPNGFENRSLPHFAQGSKTPAAKGFVENSFYSGLLQTEFFFHTMGGREGLVDTAVKTAETGYMQRRLMKCLEDLVVHYDGTVRNAEGEVVQFVYGCDGLDPSFMEGKGCPVEFDRVLEHVRACYSYRDEKDVSLELLEKYLNYLFDDSCKVTDMEEDKTWKPKAKRVFKKNVSNVNSEEENVSKSDKVLLNKLNNVDRKKIEECKGVLKECDIYFKNDMWKFMQSIMERKEKVKKRYGNVKVATEIERLTFGQLCEFLKTCSQKYVRSVVEPGSAVGALAAQSIGEPGTQMTLKTFHFAGVAAMNITQGVPRIKEIMNASQKILTPVITVELDNAFDEGFARKVKARIEKTTLGEITNCIREIYVSNKVLLKVELNLTKIKLLKLEIDPDTVKCSLLTTSLKPKLLPEYIKVVDDSTLYITVPVDKINHKMNFTSLTLKDAICKVPVMGLKSINHVTLNRKMYNKKEGINLLVEGDNFREVLATYGVNGTRTLSNNIYQVYITLGIEAARTTIIKEINDVLVNHGMSVDYRHIMLLAAQMTHTGEVLGIQRHGLAKMKQSVFNLASFERTADHLFDAAYYGQVDKIAGVSENIIVGTPAPIGTGIFQLLQKIPTPEPPAPLKLLFDRQEFHS